MTQKVLAVAKVPSLDPTLDGFTNSFVFETTDVAPYANSGPVFSAIEAFYNTTATGATHPVAYYLAKSLDGGTNHSTINLYDITAHLDGTPHGSPVASVNWTYGIGVFGGPLPEESCAVLSFQKLYGSDVEFGPSGSAIPTPPDIQADFGAAATHLGRTRPRSRDRGRLFIGPLSQNAVIADASTFRCELASGCINDILKAAFALNATITSGGTNYNQRQWSRRNAAVSLIDHFWMENFVASQRRRVDKSGLTKTTQIGQGV